MEQYKCLSFYTKQYSDEHKRKTNAKLGSRFNQNTTDYLKWEIKLLFEDYFDLEALFDTHKISPDSFNDYSFAIAPIYKGFEGFMFQLGCDLGLFSEADLPNSPASFYEENQISTAIKKLIQGILSLNKKIDKNKFEDIKGRLLEMRNLLKRYRHTPAHYQGNQCIPNFHKAKDYAASVIFNMNDMIKIFFETGLLTAGNFKGSIL